MKKYAFIHILILTLGSGQMYQPLDYEKSAIAFSPSALNMLYEFISIPNGSRDTENIERNVVWCMDRFTALGFDSKTIRIGKTPFGLATKMIDKAKPTLLVYLQIDGQPVDPSKWDQANPYVPQVKRKGKPINWDQFIVNPNVNDKIYARSSSDSKGPAVAFISALKILKERGQSLPYNLKVVMDFQEEISSPDMPKFVQRNKRALQADYLLIMDGSRFTHNEPTLTFGARGIAKMVLTVYGPKTPMHSGQYGNFIPNPVFKAGKLISAMKDEDGRVLIPGWYDGISLSTRERELLNTSNVDARELANRFGVADWDKVGTTYQEALQYPTLNIRGIQGGWVGKGVRTIIPDKVVIEIDIRLVPEKDGEAMVQMVRSYIQAQGFHILEKDPTPKEREKFENLIKIESSVGYPAFQTPLDSPIGEWLTTAHKKALGQSPIKYRRTGGSQPMAPFVRALNIPAAAVRIPNPNNQIHGPNENIRVGNFLEGIQINLGILTTTLER